MRKNSFCLETLMLRIEDKKEVKNMQRNKSQKNTKKMSEKTIELKMRNLKSLEGSF